MSIPEWIYLAMGAVIARIILNGTQTQGYRPMDWIRLVFDISRIVILWPLVLFVEKIESWLNAEPQSHYLENTKDVILYQESSQVDPVKTGGSQ